MEEYPNLRDPVVLRDHADREYVSRVNDLGVGLLVVTQPHDLPVDETFGAGTKLSVLWAESDGSVTVLPTQIMAMRAEGPLQLLSLFVTGPASTEQRRRSPRVAADGPVALRSASDDDTEAVPGNLMDVSEGGVRCEVEVGAADRFLAGSNEVIAEFRFGAVDFAVPGRVEFLRASARPAEFEAVVVVFDELAADVDVLRKEVFAHQVETAPGPAEGE